MSFGFKVKSFRFCTTDENAKCIFFFFSPVTALRAEINFLSQDMRLNPEPSNLKQSQQLAVK